MKAEYFPPKKKNLLLWNSQQVKRQQKHQISRKFKNVLFWAFLSSISDISCVSHLKLFGNLKRSKIENFRISKIFKKRKLEYAIKNKSLKCIGTNRKEIPQRLRNWTRTTGTENLPKLPMAIKIFSPFKAPKYKVLCWHLRHLKISRFNCLRPTPFLTIQG